MPKHEYDKDKNALYAYSNISRVRKKAERPKSNMSQVSFQRNARGNQDTYMLPLEREIRRKANSSGGVCIDTHTQKIHVHTYVCMDKYKQVQYFRVYITTLAGASLNQGVDVHSFKPNFN